MSALATLDDLPPKRAAFVLAYLGEAQGNGTEAARIAGYASPETEAYRLLRNEQITAVVESVRKEAYSAKIMSFEEMAAALSAIARGDIGEAVTDLAGQPTGEVISKPSDRIAAMKQLAKVMGYEASQRHEVELRPAPMPLEDARKVVLLHRKEDANAG